MLIEQNGNYVKLAREEMKKRYQIVDKDTQMTLSRFLIESIVQAG